MPEAQRAPLRQRHRDDLAVLTVHAVAAEHLAIEQVPLAAALAADDQSLKATSADLLAAIRVVVARIGIPSIAEAAGTEIKTVKGIVKSLTESDHASDQMTTMPADLLRTSSQRISAALAAASKYYTSTTPPHRGVANLTGRRIKVALLETHLAELEVGRNIGDPPDPKCKNPQCTANYDKSIGLYPLLPAPVHPDVRVIKVEGNLETHMAIAMSAIRTGQADRLCPLAQSDKELTDPQLSTVVRLHPNPPVISLVGDVTGRESNQCDERAVVQPGATVTVVPLPVVHHFARVLGEQGEFGQATWDTTSRRIHHRTSGTYLRYAKAGTDVPAFEPKGVEQ